MCGRVIQSSGPLRYAILEGMHVRDSRVHNYPSEAQSRSEEGIVLLSFSLDRTGHVLAHRIARSSGFADLDNEVMAMILRAEPLPAFPPSMPQPQLDLTVPIRFSLR